MHVGQMVTDAVDVLACSIDAFFLLLFSSLFFLFSFCVCVCVCGDLVVAPVNFPSYFLCIVCIVKYIFGDFPPSTDL